MKTLFTKLKIVLWGSLLICGVNVHSQSNQYLDYDGIDDYVALTNGSQYLANSPGMTIAGWFYDNALGYGQGMMGFRGTQGFYMIQLADGKIECRFLNSANTLYEYVAPANTIIPLMWQHFAWVYDGSAIKLYVNGNLKGQKAASGTFTATDIPFAIGRSIAGGGLNFYWNGRIDEVSAWNKALSQAEIQSMIQDELTGTEANLQMYYKFNQGVPGGNNTSITTLTSKVQSPARDADILNFAMVGPTSNFNGELDTTYQAIAFDPIATKLVSNPPFDLIASSTSGLPVEFSLISGPATVTGNTVTLTGDTGTVIIEANQPGNAQYNPADPVRQAFAVINPQLHVPKIDLRNPLAGDVYVSALAPIQLAVISDIQYPDLFQVSHVVFHIDNQDIPAQDFYNHHYTAWWTPPGYGSYVLQIISTNNFGFSATKTVNINITTSNTDITAEAFKNVWLSPSVASAVVEASLPSFLGTYDAIDATLTVHCPTGGCGAWDRIASIDARDHEGNWFEIIRYITPYGVPCTHTINLADYASILQGKVAFRANCSTLDNGFLYDLNITYRHGNPPHMYSRVTQIWKKEYQFGDYANLQPVIPVNYQFPGNTAAATLKLVSTGHGWGSLNTNNAAEFYDATHQITVNGVNTFTQHNWQDCNPNPDGCSPQNGTWYYDRAGWCPGSIAHWFDYNLGQFVGSSDITLGYKFLESYVDQCHPNNPNCVTGVTCTDCSDGFNPYLDVACNLVAFADSPIVVVGTDKHEAPASAIHVFPNPGSGLFKFIKLRDSSGQPVTIRIFDNFGNLLYQTETNQESLYIDFTAHAAGVYHLQATCSKWTDRVKLIIN